MQEFKDAVKRNDIKAVKQYIKNIIPSYYSNWAIRYASKYGYLEVVKLILSDKCVDPTIKYNYPIVKASENGHLEVVRLLLSDSWADPSAFNNWSIREASENGHLEVVKLLLTEPRVDPSDDSNQAICAASDNGHLEVVRLLLSDPRVDFNAIDDEELKEQLLKEERNKLRQEFTFKYQVIQKASPQISFEGKQKSKIPSALIRKIVYEASYQERSTSIRLLALEKLIDKID